ncbi:MAG: RCC1 domain-containing protein, partial [Bacteriovoracia bacterium]
RLQDPLNSALDRQSGEDITLTLTGTNVTTQGALDWVLGATTVVIPAGQTRVSIPVTAVQDGVDEEDEVLDVVLSNTMGYSQSTATHRVTILDNDAPPTVAFQLASQTIAEAPSDPKTLPVNLVLSRASQRDITVSYQIGGSASTSTSGSCTVTSDVSATGSIVIPAGTTLMPMGLLLCFDQRYEGTETLVLTLQSATNGSLGTSIVHTATITDDEQLPALGLSTSDPSPLEYDGSFTLTAAITNGITAQSDMVVPVTFTGTAVRGAHYQYPVGSITITAGQSSGTLTIDLLNNNLYGGEKSLTATLGTGPWTLSTALQNITILEDELVPQIGFANPDPVVSEAATAQTLTVHVKPGFPACEGSMTVGLARAGTAIFGSDHDFNFSTAGLAPGQSSTTLSYNVINDNMYEGVTNETLQVTISSAICNGVNILLLQPASPGTTTVQIDDDDPQPAVGYEVLTQSFTESDSSAAIVVRLERPSYQPITVRSELVARVRDPGTTTTPNAAKYFQAITSDGTVDDPNDLAAGTVDIVIPAGQVTGVHPLNLNNDSNYEYTETATFTLSLPFGGEATVSSSQNQMVVSILDNDPRPFVHLALDNTVETLSVAESVSEANTEALPLYAVLTNCYRNGATCNRDFATGLAVPNFAPAKITTVVPIEVNVSLQGTAITDDYTTTLADSTIVIPAYTQEASVTTTNVDDTLFENDETIRFVASAVINSRLSETNTQVTRTILDDDPAPTITATPSVATAQEGDSVFFTVTVPPIGKAITLSYTTLDPSPGATSATPGVDHNLADGTFIVNPSNIDQNIVLNFTVTNDTTPEAAETIELHMSATPGTDAVFTNPLATLTIDVSDAVRLAAGAEHTCGLLGGQVKCWGKESVLGYDGPAPEITNNGFYGIDAEETVALLPTVNLGAGFVPTKIVAGVDFTCALSSSGNVKCWGINSRGQLGQGLPNISPSTFIGDETGEMGDNLANLILGDQVVDIVAGSNHACALLNTGRMKCWGSNEFGQLGQPRTGAACTDTASSFCIGDGVDEMAALNTINFPVDETVVQMAAGTNVTCALLVSGRIYCFGRNNLGQLGQDRDVAEWGAAPTDMVDPAFVPVQFNAAFSGLPVVGLVAGDRAICSVFQTNSTRMDVMCWGNGRGRSASPLASVSTPAALFNSTFGTVASEFNILRSIAAGSSNVCVRGQGNEVLCWDSDANGRLGNGGSETSTPDAWGTDLTDAARVTNPDFPESFLNLTTGNNHSCAAVDVDKFRCWGLNTSGQAGNLSNVDLTSPSSSIDFD